MQKGRKMMKLTMAVVILAGLSLAVAQEAKPVSVKGHTMGESVSEFAKAVGFELSECPQIVKLTPKDARKQKMLDVFNAKYSGCMGFADAQNGHPVVVLFSYDDNLKGRVQVRSDTTTVGQFTDVAGVIEKQKLVEFWVKPNPSTYTFDDIVSELIGKYGQPATTKSDTVQNGYGGLMKLGGDRWMLTDGTVIVVSENIVHTEPAGYAKAVSVGYFTKERWAELASQKKPNALD
jgi:hypothetical protein